MERDKTDRVLREGGEKWNVKEDFCGEGATYSSCSPMLYHICPSVKIQTDREMTQDERRRVIDALVKAASVEMIHINDE